MAAGVTPVAAYAPKGAASLAASYTNLANPGTYDAAPGVAPTWDAATGWAFVTNKYLTTGIIPASGWTMIVKFSNQVGLGCLIGESSAGANFGLYGDDGTVKKYYLSGGVLTLAPKATSGVMAVAAQVCYLDGSSVGTIATAWSNTTSYQIDIGRRNGAAPLHYLTGKIQSVWIASSTLSAAQIATQSAAMP